MFPNRLPVLRRAFVDSLPVLMGYTTMGFVAGVLLAAKAGISCATLWGFLTSLCCVSGTFNFAIVQPLAERLSLWQIALLTLSINFRYAFYGFSMLGRWRKVPLLKKLFLIHMLSDENYALETVADDSDEGYYLRYCLAVSLLNLSYWVIGVTSGAAVVALLEHALDPEVLRRATTGMDFAMVALFLVIFTDQIKGFCRHDQ